MLCLESHKAETKISTKLASTLKTLGEASTLKLVQVFGRNTWGCRTKVPFSSSRLLVIDG